MAYLQLLETDWLEAARTVDERFHAAKLMAAAFNEPARLWEEHDAVRRELLAPHTTAPTLTPDLLARAAALWKRARELERRAAQSSTSEMH